MDSITKEFVPSAATETPLKAPEETQASERARMTFVIATLVFAGLADYISYRLALGWMAASGLTAFLVLSILGFITYYRDKFFLQLFVFGLFAGFAELPSDHYAVSVVKIMVYPQEGPFIWSSPLYMPFSYIIVMVQLGYLSYWITHRYGLLKATIAIAIFGGINVPSYEFMAKGADFWYYKDCKMLFGVVPYVTITSEFLFTLVLPAIVSLFKRLNWGWIVVLGILEGAWMFITFYIGFKLIG